MRVMRAIHALFVPAATSIELLQLSLAAEPRYAVVDETGQYLLSTTERFVLSNILVTDTGSGTAVN